MYHNGAVANTPEFQSSGPGSFPGRGECDLLFNLDIVKLLLKNNGGGGDTEHLILSSWFGLLWFFAGGWCRIGTESFSLGWLKSHLLCTWLNSRMGDAG